VRSSKLWLLAGIAVASGLALYSATQTWVTLSLVQGAAAFGWLEVTGQQVNQSLSPIAIASLAAALALTIAGKAFRRVLGVLVALLGAGITSISVIALRNPSGAAAGRLAEATGIMGPSQLELVTNSMVSSVIAVTLGAGIALVVLGVLVLLLGGRWKAAGRKYEVAADDREVSAPRQIDAEPDRISDWETMSAGGDPSSLDEPDHGRE
jgi:uncharacterized membrane protein (TIGR02234 family)